MDPTAVEVFVGLDVGKGEHHATVLDGDGNVVVARAVANDQAALEAILDEASAHGHAGAGG